MMPLSFRLLSVLAAGCFAPLVWAQKFDGERSAPFEPVRPLTKDDLDHNESLKLYSLGLLQQRDNRLIEALGSFEQARRLAPEATAIQKTLIPLYLALDRVDEALATCRSLLDLSPGDYQTWLIYARQLKLQDRRAEARAALERGVACVGLKDRPDLQVTMLFDLGILSEDARDLPRAMAAFREAARVLDNPEAILDQGPFVRAEIDNKALEANERLGRVALRAGLFDEALTAFQKAQTKLQDTQKNAGRRFSLYLGEVFLAQRKPDEAIASLQDYLATQPSSIEGYELLVKALKAAERERETLSLLDRYLNLDRANASLRLFVATQYSQAGNTPEARRRYQALLSDSPQPEVYRALFALYKSSVPPGYEQVLQELKNALPAPARNQTTSPVSDVNAARARAMLVALRDDPELVKNLLPIAVGQLGVGGGLSWELRSMLAVLAARTRQLDAAERLYRDCLDNLGAGVHRNEPEIYGGLLRVLWQAHKHQAIVDLCRAGIKRAEATSRVMFHVDLARALSMLGKDEEALTEAAFAVDVSREEERLYCQRVRIDILAHAGKVDLAVAACEALLKSTTDKGDLRDIRYALAGVYSEARNFARAEEQLLLLLQSDPNDAGANNDLGYQWADQNKNLEEAERMIRKALALDRKQRASGNQVTADSDLDNGAYVDSLGWVLFRKGRLPEARKELERAASLPTGTDDSVVWDHLGDVYARQNEPARAKEAWAKAVLLYEEGKRRQSDSRYKDIKEKLKLLDLDRQP
jgi:tetratricopeptide (TPR) repeat protein